MKIEQNNGYNDKEMTYTTQTYSICTIEKTEKTVKTETEELTRDILSVCESLDKLHDVLVRLEHVLRKNIEVNLSQNGPRVSIIYNKGVAS